MADFYNRFLCIANELRQMKYINTIILQKTWSLQGAILRAIIAVEIDDRIFCKTCLKRHTRSRGKK